MEKEIFGFIYDLIDGTNDFEYIGQTTQTVEARFKQHKKSEQYIDRMIQDHGDLFVVVTLKVCYSKEELDYWEKRIIKARGTRYPNGYNMTDGGEGVSGWKHTDEIKAQISATSTGRKHTEKALANMSAAQKKRFENPEEHIKASAAQKKRYEDPAEHVKTSEALKKSRAENPISPESHSQQAESLRKYYEENPEARQHLADMTNKQFEDPEARKRHSEIMTQYYQENPISKETTDKQSVSLKKYYEENPEARKAISERNIERFKDPAEHEKISRGLKKFHEENPDAAIRMSESQKKSYAENPERREKHSASQKARRERERIERLPIKVAEQNQASAQLPMPLPNLKKYHDEHPNKIKMPLPKGYAELATPIKKSTAKRHEHLNSRQNSRP